MFPDLTPNTRPLRIPDKEEGVFQIQTLQNDWTQKYHTIQNAECIGVLGTTIRTDYCVIITLTKGNALLRALQALTFRTNKAWSCDSVI
jgi:hypothetical protein